MVGEEVVVMLVPAIAHACHIRLMLLQLRSITYRHLKHMVGATICFKGPIGA